MLPQIEWATRVCNYPCLVMNPKETNKLINGQEVPIPICKSMDTHAAYVWRQYVMSSGFKKLLVIAHSAGGSCVGGIIGWFSDHFYATVA